MAHDWKSVNFGPGTEYFSEYWGSYDVRKCNKCGKVQAKQADHVWGRIVGYYWRPKVGRCPADRKEKK